MAHESTTASCCTSQISAPSFFKRLADAASSFQLAPALSQFASASLVTASAGLGACYAWGVGIEHGAILGVLFVLFAVGLEIAKPLSVVAAFTAFRSWQLVRGAALAILALVAITYSLSAELTLMAGSRGDVVAERQAMLKANVNADDEAQRAKDRYETTRAELARLAPSRPAGEVQAEVAVLKHDRLYDRSKQCTEANRPESREHCTNIARLEAEKARADRKAELEAIVAIPLPTTAATSNVHPQPSGKSVKDADPGASALAVYLTALGIVLPATVLTDWLALVPVLALELGSALAGILVQATPPTVRNGNALPDATATRIEAVGNTTAQEVGNGVPNLIGTSVPALMPPSTEPVSQGAVSSVPMCPRKPDDEDDSGNGPSNGARLGTALLHHLRDNGGKVTAGQRGLARLLETSTTELNRTLHRLAAAGVLLVTPDRLAGTTIELAAA